jgi:hypothetical protein
MWVEHSAPVECGRLRETAQRSEPAGFAEQGYRAWRSRQCWGSRPHLIATPHGFPAGLGLAGAKADEREILFSILTTGCPAARAQAGHAQILNGAKNYFWRRSGTG